MSVFYCDCQYQVHFYSANCLRIFLSQTSVMSDTAVAVHERPEVPLAGRDPCLSQDLRFLCVFGVRGTGREFESSEVASLLPLAIITKFNKYIWCRSELH